PNVVLIVIDDLGQRDLGCYGSGFYETPNVDRLAESGMRFTQYYAANPVCSPTRASLQTGRNPARLNLTNFLKGVRQKKDSPMLTAEYVDQLPLEEVTLGEMFKTAGYQTAFVGKWHLGGESFYPEPQGYDVNIGGTHAGHPKSYFWPQWQNNPPVEGEREGQYLTDLLSERACEWIESAAKNEQPFFLSLCHYTVHTPIQPREDLLKKYEDKLSRIRLREGSQSNPHYAAMVESMDTSVGRVLDTLDRLKIADDTLVIFTADNGGLSVQEGKHTPATTNAPLRMGKGYLYDGGIRVAFIVRWPGVTPAGSTCDVPAISDDVFPTLCRAAGVETEKLQLAGPLDGRDLSNVLKGETDAALSDRPLHWHYPHFANQGGPPGGAIRVGDWKLIEWFEDGTLELYNLADDLSETTDLAAEQPDRIRDMRAALSQWRREVHANMPTANPAYEGAATPVIER
ncbi:MAG: sulfatase, partial [Planctomycetaceae bacterium]|nr:sulfatase [Planctomycetaceae bacterium]